MEERIRRRFNTAKPQTFLRHPRRSRKARRPSKGSKSKSHRSASRDACRRQFAVVLDHVVILIIINGAVTPICKMMSSRIPSGTVALVVCKFEGSWALKHFSCSPLLNAWRLCARSSHGISAMISRISTRVGTPASMAANGAYHVVIRQPAGLAKAVNRKLVRPRVRALRFH
jgi:hypothetical protein